MREPDPMRSCRVNGDCPVCNPPPRWCQRCLEVTVEDGEEHCEACKVLLAEDEAEEPSL